MEPSLSLVEPDKLCRLCLNDRCVLKDLFEPTNENSATLLEKISFSTSIQVQDADRADFLPTKICSDCSDQVEKLYDFKRKCLATDRLLRKHARLKLNLKF